MSAPTLAFKGVAVDEGTDSQIVDINEAEGVVTAVVSVTGTKDDVDDVIMPGAYAETLKARNPKVCWHHSWEKPIGRVLSIVELLPGDRRLPTKQRNGQPWPKEAGALIATMQFNMKSQRGKEAFEAVVFYSETGECEWSIGYQVQAGKSRRDKQGVRWIKAIDLFELSFVLFGAHNMTGTLALKAAMLVMQMHAAATKAADTDVVLRREEFDQALKALKLDEDEAEDEDGEDDQEPKPKQDQEPKQDQDPEDGEDAPPTAPPTFAEPGDVAAADPGDFTADDEDDEPPVAITEVDGDQAELISAEDDEDEDDEDDEERRMHAAAKTLDAARVTIKANQLALRIRREHKDADTSIEDTCTCGDQVLFDTMNGWMRKDGSYSHDDGTTHSDHLEPPDADELAEAGVKEAIRGNGWRLDSNGMITFEKAGVYRFGTLLTPLGELKDTNPGDQSQGARELIHWYEHGEGAAKIRWGEDGDFMRCVHIAEKHMTPEQAKGFCSNRHLGALGVRPGQEKAYDGDAMADVDPLDKEPPDHTANEEEPEHTGVMVAVYPAEDAAKQIAVRGGEEPEELHVTLAYLGDMTDQVSGGMTLEDATATIIAAAQIAAATNQPLTGSVGGLGKFPDSGDGVPIWAPVDVVGLSALREAVVTALEDAGLPVKTDHGFTPHMTVGWNLDMNLIQPIDDVPVTFDKLVVCVGGERTEVPLGGDPDIPSSGAPVAGPDLNPPLPDEKAAMWNPAIETGPDAGHRPAVARPHKSFPYLEGTFEERQRAIERALNEALLPDREEMANTPADAWLNIDGTYPDRVVCTVNEYQGPGPGSNQSWEVPYTFDEDGTVTLGEPEKVKLSVVAVDDEGEDLPDDVPVGDLLPLAEMVEIVTNGVKTLTSGLEGKAGRVLSAANAQRLRSAVEHLISVLAAAGIEVGDPTDRPGRVEPAVDTETTAPSARDGGSKTLATADVAATLANLSAALED